MATRVLVDPFLDAVAWLVGHGLFRTVEVDGGDRIPTGRPLLVVANHFNGLVDAVLLAVIVRGVPRFIAKGTLWRSPLLRPLLAFAGLVPVSRPEDAGGTVDNTVMFDRAHRVLRRRGTLAIFPEGTTHDHLELQRVRTGAARIALGARTGGVSNVTIVPIGLTFDDKLALRSRVLARVGTPIDVDAWAASVNPTEAGVRPDSHDATRRLTDRIAGHLAATTPRYADVLDRAMLNRAADVRLRTELADPTAIVPLRRREAVAQRLADAPEAERQAVLDALGTYQVQLNLLGLRDEQLMPRVRAAWLLRRALGLTAYLAVLGVLVVAGIAANLVPTILTALAGRRPEAPVTKGTVRVLTALLVYPLTWLIIAVLAPVTGWLPTTAVFLACPAAGAVAVGGLERAIALVRAWTGWMGLRNARGLLDRLHETRQRVCDRVDAAAGQP
ncbi:MAG: 1-acyl-sn-glycerol-3-phosphate acyltransferase [Actinobacteria bacterium]|nr:1-acyl-sn-glycerol-3-phosphate acyltransferase [Actinomycetota bacterium]